MVEAVAKIIQPLLVVLVVVAGVAQMVRHYKQVEQEIPPTPLHRKAITVGTGFKIVEVVVEVVHLLWGVLPEEMEPPHLFQEHQQLTQVVVEPEALLLGTQVEQVVEALEVRVINQLQPELQIQAVAVAVQEVV